MKLACPECGSQFSLPVATSDIAARQVSKLMAEMPRVVGLVITQYLALFRPAKSSLRWSRVLLILQELVPHINNSTVTHNGNTRRAPAELWAEGIRIMQDQEKSITRPIKKHAYLYKVVFSLADKQAAVDEADHISKLRNRSGDGAPSYSESLMPKYIKLNSLKNELVSLNRLIANCPGHELLPQAEALEKRITKMETTQ